MPLADAFLSGSRISSRGIENERALDLDEKQLDLQSQRDTATRQNNRLKNRLDRLKFNADLVTDRDQPDIFRLQAANEYNRMVGLPITFTDITEIDKVQKVFEKQKNLIKRHEKGEIGSESLTRAIRGLQAEYNAVLGSTDAFAPAVKTAEEGAKREFENDVFKVSEILRKSAQGGKATTEEASFMAKLKKSNNPRSQAVLRDGIRLSREGSSRDFSIKKDELGNLIGIDPRTLQRFPVPRQEGGRLPDLRDVTQPERQAQQFITAPELGKATGPLSFGANILAASFGWILPGEQFAGIKSAQNKVKNLNKKIVQTLVLSPRFPVFEQQQIQGFLIDPGKFWADPGSASGKILDLKDFLVVTKQGFENQLNQTISAEQRKNLTGKLGNIDSILDLLPSDLSLKIVSGREISIDEIRNFPKSDLGLLPKEVKKQMLRRLEAGEGKTSGSF